MSTPLPPAVLAALNADLAVPGRWMMIGGHVSIEEHAEGDPPVVVRVRHVAATLQCGARSLTLVVMLTGPEFGAPTAAVVHYMGTPFTTADATLIARVDSRVAPLIGLRGDELLARLTAPVEP